MARPSDQPLERYWDKRDAARTPEPAASARAGGSVFVVHHHAARQTHYDLRLEVNGSLWSWAVPKGPSIHPEDKRLAVHVEDHPVDYAWFEDHIPAGNYGAGAMIVWDRGPWVALEDPIEGLAKGKLLFELHGHKLFGKWTLVRTNRGQGRDWLLMKERDAWVGRIPEPPMDSIVSGLTVEQLKLKYNPEPPLLRRLHRLHPPPISTALSRLRPMLCQTAKPFSDPAWLFEVKYDGYRVLAVREVDQVRLFTRRGRDLTCNFPELAEAIAGLPFQCFAMDGELTVNGPDGVPNFGRLQKRAQLSRPADVARASVALPATLYVFDLIAFKDFDLRPLPLAQRKKALRELLPSVGVIRYVDHIDSAGEAAFEHAIGLGLEGLVAKRANSPYVCGQRSPDWLKLTGLKSGDFVVVGYIPAPGEDFRAVLLAQHDAQRWVYVGRAGSGLDAVARAQLLVELVRNRAVAPTIEVPDAPNDVVWTKPRIVVEIRFKNYTAGGQLRQPVLLRHRMDKPAADCIRPMRRSALQEPAVIVAAPQARSRVILSNLEKVFWPASGLTKGDLLNHYRAIAPWMLPYLKDRPVVLTRYPDGIEGTSFFQHQAPEYLPEWIRTERLLKSANDEKDYIVIDDEDTLLYIVNLGTIPIHAWSARCQSIEKPDWCILDLDPKSAPLTDVVAVAATLHEICTSVALPHYLKTSGGSGLHILIPLGGQLDHRQSRTLGELLARLCVARRPDIATIQRALELRNGRVYVDYLQNGYGKTIAAPYCARPNPQARVSMPLRFSELKTRLDVNRFHVKNAARRMRALGQDPMRALLEDTADIPAVLAALAELRESTVD